MIELSDSEQSATFLALLDAWKVPPELNTPEAVSRHAMARLISFHTDDIAGVIGAAMVLKYARLQMVQDGTAKHRYFAVDMTSLAALCGSEEGAQLAAGCAGYWPTTAADGSVEWSDCDWTGGGRNLIDVAEIGAADDPDAEAA